MNPCPNLVLTGSRVVGRRFFNLILMPRVVDDINENKALNYHLYQALRKALYKPAAFYKGVLLPLCEVRWPPVCRQKHRILQR